MGWRYGLVGDLVCREPGDRVDLGAVLTVHANLEVKVRSGGPAAGALQADLFAGVDLFSGDDVDPGEVTVGRDHVVLVQDRHIAAVAGSPARVEHGAPMGGH